MCLACFDITKKCNAREKLLSCITTLCIHFSTQGNLSTILSPDRSAESEMANKQNAVIDTEQQDANDSEPNHFCGFGGKLASKDDETQSASIEGALQEDASVKQVTSLLEELLDTSLTLWF